MTNKKRIYNPDSKFWTIKWWLILKCKSIKEKIDNVITAGIIMFAVFYEKFLIPAMVYHYDIVSDALRTYFEPITVDLPYLWNQMIFNIKNFKFKRWCRLFWQRRTRGWDDSETWSLDHTTACFLYPRIKRFRQLVHGKIVPMGLTIEQWDQILEKMEDAFFLYSKKWECEVQFKGAVVDPESAESQKIIEEGLELYHEYFRALWW